MIRALGLSGFAQSGKTTAALYIKSRFGFRRKHIAEPLRAMLAVLLKANGYNDVDITDILEGSRKDGWIIPELGVTSRHLQITLGTEWGRSHISPNVWSNTWVRSTQPGEKVMNDSVRFPNEEDAIRDMGGITILIDRPGTRPGKFKDAVGEMQYDSFGDWSGVHDSERLDLLHPDHVIGNDGSIDDLYNRIDDVMESRGIRKLNPLVGVREIEHIAQKMRVKPRGNDTLLVARSRGTDTIQVGMVEA